MSTAFVKMHGAGNDYLFVDCLQEPEPAGLAQLARRWSARHTGIGSDGLIVLLPSSCGDARMRMFNTDGSEAQMCGNGLRCMAKYLFDRKLGGQHLKLETGAQLIEAEVTREEPAGVAKRIALSLSPPRFERRLIPMQGPGGEVCEESLEVGNRRLELSAVDLGNPHGVVFVDDVQSWPLQQVGSQLNADLRFPIGINLSIAQVLDRESLRLRTFERGSGETQACGSGAAAAAIVARRQRGLASPIRVLVPGGELGIAWPGGSSPVRLEGPAEEVFAGTFPD
jgi:diaminopimelate epimerase